MLAVRLMRDGHRHGRRQVSNIACPYAQPLLTLAHAWCPEFAGSDFTFDEASSSFHAQDFADLDQLVAGALTHARHQRVRVRLVTPAIADLETRMRRLATVFLLCKRIGPGGEGEDLPPGPRFPLLRFFPRRAPRPRGFRVFAFKRSDYNADWTLKEKVVPFARWRYPFSAAIASAYDSHSDHVDERLARQVDALRAGAKVAVDLPRFQFLNGKVLPLALPPLDVWWPVAPAVEGKRYKPVDEVRADEVRSRVLSGYGLHTGDGAPTGSVVPFAPIPAGASHSPMRGRILWCRTIDGMAGAILLSVRNDRTDGVQEIVLPAALAGDLEPAVLVGQTLACVLAYWTQDGVPICAPLLTAPVHLFKEEAA